MFKRRPQGFVALMVLESMEDGPTYGYEIIQRAKEISGGHWDPSYGTIYGALNRLEDKGVIEPAEVDGHEDRQYYKLTEKGRDKLEEGRTWKQEERPNSLDIILGLIHSYHYLHGDKELVRLLNTIEEEFGSALNASPEMKDDKDHQEDGKSES